VSPIVSAVLVRKPSLGTAAAPDSIFRDVLGVTDQHLATLISANRKHVAETLKRCQDRAASDQLLTLDGRLIEAAKISV
jgi:hypothetical protein